MTLKYSPHVMYAINSLDARTGRQVCRIFEQYALAHDQFRIDHKHGPLCAAHRTLLQSIVTLLGGTHQGTCQLNRCWIAETKPDLGDFLRVPPRTSRLYE